jgi:hypothetical protein
MPLDCRPATTQHLLVVQAVNLCSSIGPRLSHERTQGDFPLPPIRFHASQRYNASTRAQTSTRRGSRSRYRLLFFLSRSIYYILGEICLRERRGKSRWTPWPFRLSQLTLGLAIRWRNPPAEAGPRTQYFYGYKGGIGY